MTLCQEIPITDYCDQNKLTTRERLELFGSVCQAVQHAHQKGIIHRDIKPTNVMVTMRDDTPIAKVIDFGVAKATNQRLTEKTLFTRYSQMIGTPLYMSPEQAQMNEWDVDTRSDIYSLGVLLYELLSGTTPFDKERLRRAAYDELLKIIREEEPPKPSMRISTLGDMATDVSAHRKSDPKKLSAVIRGELDWIVMKALEKDRTRRYESASNLAADVERYLHEEAVEACPPSVAYRTRKFIRRNKLLVITGLVVAASLLLGLVGTTVNSFRASRAETKAHNEALLAERAAIRANEEATRADEEATRAQTAAQSERSARQHLQTQVYVSEMNLASYLLQDGQMERVSQLLDRHLPSSDADQRGFEWHYYWRRCHADFQRLAHWGRVRCLAFSPDGKKLATGFGDGFIIGEIELWNATTGDRLDSLKGLYGPPHSLAFSHDGKMLASRDGRAVTLWDLETGEPRATIEHKKDLGQPAFSPDGRTLAVLHRPDRQSPQQTRLRLFDLATGLQKTSTAFHVDFHSKRQLAFSPAGSRLAVIPGKRQAAPLGRGRSAEFHRCHARISRRRLVLRVLTRRRPLGRGRQERRNSHPRPAVPQSNSPNCPTRR